MFDHGWERFPPQRVVISSLPLSLSLGALDCTVVPIDSDVESVTRMVCCLTALRTLGEHEPPFGGDVLESRSPVGADWMSTRRDDFRLDGASVQTLCSVPNPFPSSTPR